MSLEQALWAVVTSSWRARGQLREQHLQGTTAVADAVLLAGRQLSHALATQRVCTGVVDDKEGIVAEAAAAPLDEAPGWPAA